NRKLKKLSIDTINSSVIGAYKKLIRTPIAGDI
ncbi:unnamed protein product, partial [marine sediment metagenome]